MKILVVGEGSAPIHEAAVATAFKTLGHEVSTFYWRRYFKVEKKTHRIWLKFQNKFLLGSELKKINNDFVNMAINLAPDLIFIYRGTHIRPSAIDLIKQRAKTTIICGYNNDDPFSRQHPFWLWRLFLRSIPKYDFMFAYRRHNIQGYYNHGAKKVDLLMPWFIPEFDKPEPNGAGFEFDVVFVGHYEKDQRLEYLQAIDNGKYKLGLFGPDWGRAGNLQWLKKYTPIQPVRGDSYRKTLCSAKVALCFLSRLNRDSYTRRCFEIPVMGVFLLSEYSDDLAAIFRDGVDAVLFHDVNDMLDKLKYYLKHDELRQQIAENGRKRVIRDGHDVISRMRYVQDIVNESMLEH